LSYVSLEDVCRPGPVWMSPIWTGNLQGPLESFDHGVGEEGNLSSRDEVGEEMEWSAEEEGDIKELETEEEETQAAIYESSPRHLESIDSSSQQSSPMFDATQTASESPLTHESRSNHAPSRSPREIETGRQWFCEHANCGRLFSKRHDLNRHKKYHAKPHRCREPSCMARNVAFSLQKDLVRHEASHNGQSYFCPSTGCKYATDGSAGGFPRKDNMMRHIRNSACRIERYGVPND